MIIHLAVEAIVSHTVSDDKTAVTIAFKSGEDEVRLVFPIADLGSALPILAQAHEQAKGEGRTQARVPANFSAVALAEEPGFVLAFFDRGLPNQVAYMLTAEHSKSLGKAFMAHGRMAAEARSRKPIERPGEKTIEEDLREKFAGAFKDPPTEASH